MNRIATDAADPGHVSAALLRCNLVALGGQSRHGVDRRNRSVLTHLRHRLPQIAVVHNASITLQWVG